MYWRSEQYSSVLVLVVRTVQQSLCCGGQESTTEFLYRWSLCHFFHGLPILYLPPLPWLSYSLSAPPPSAYLLFICHPCLSLPILYLPPMPRPTYSLSATPPSPYLFYQWCPWSSRTRVGLRAVACFPPSDSPGRGRRGRADTRL